jgi:hypothetical protein
MRRRPAGAPGVNYPEGCTAEVQGATVASRRDAPVLHLRRKPGAAEVHALVSPR